MDLNRYEQNSRLFVDKMSCFTYSKQTTPIAYMSNY